MFVTDFNYTNETQSASAGQYLRTSYWSGTQFNFATFSNTDDLKTASFCNNFGK